MLAAIKSLYANNTVAIKIGGQVGPSLPTCTGLKQGCPLSPTLFGLFSDGLHRHLRLRCPDVGPQLHCGTLVRDLGYADDFVLLATTPGGLQQLVDAAHKFCTETGMAICPEKTKVVVFNADLPGPYVWHCGGVPVRWEQQFKYLGAVLDAPSGISATFAALHKKMLGAWAQLKRHYGRLQCSTSVGLLMRLYSACVPSTASYGCEVWGLRKLRGDSKRGRDALGTSHLRILKQLAALPSSVSTVLLLQELGQRPLLHAWCQRTVKFWNSLAGLPNASVYKQVALDSCRDAVTRNAQNWAGAIFRGLRKLGYAHTVGFYALWPLHFLALLQLLDAPALQARLGVDICPRTYPAAGALLMQPLSARCMRILLRFRLGAHSLPVVMGRRTGTPRAQRLCQQCDPHAVGDERHMVNRLCCRARAQVPPGGAALRGARGRRRAGDARGVPSRRRPRA